MAEQLDDPRPDLAEDSILWTRFLHIANVMAPAALPDLVAFRCQGGGLKLDAGRAKLYGHVDPFGDEGSVWRTGDDYHADRERLLGRWQQNGTLRQMLAQLARTSGGETC